MGELSAVVSGESVEMGLEYRSRVGEGWGEICEGEVVGSSEGVRGRAQDGLETGGYGAEGNVTTGSQLVTIFISASASAPVAYTMDAATSIRNLLFHPSNK